LVHALDVPIAEQLAPQRLALPIQLAFGHPILPVNVMNRLNAMCA
jgi:hypothetical protein